MKPMDLVAVDQAVGMTDRDRDAMRAAVRALEHRGFAARLAGLVDKPIELLGGMLPPGAATLISTATVRALEAALKVAVATLRVGPTVGSVRLNRMLALASGAVGGSLGLVSLPVELPISTVIMLRSIADVARTQGENPDDPETALNCVQVFGLAGGSASHDVVESRYFAVRALLAQSVNEAARYIAERGLAEQGAPVLVRFIGQIASRFGVVVTEKFAARAVPVLGALGGATVNVAFVDHFQTIAYGHFTLRRLERTYGLDLVRNEYERVRREFA